MVALIVCCPAGILKLGLIRETQSCDTASNLSCVLVLIMTHSTIPGYMVGISSVCHICLLFIVCISASSAVYNIIVSATGCCLMLDVGTRWARKGTRDILLRFSRSWPSTTKLIAFCTSSFALW